MASAIVVTTTFDRLKDAVKEFPPRAREAGRQQDIRSAIRFAAEMRTRLRAQTKGTGLTASAIDVDTQAKSVRIVVRETPFRLPMLPFWLEFGTRKMPARPFIQPTIRANEAQHHRDKEAAVEAAIQEVFEHGA